MENNSIPANTFANDTLTVELPEFRGLPAISVNMSALKYAESRLIEAKIVNPSTYAELEYVFNEAYRELKKNLATISYQIAKTDGELQRSRALAILDRYPKFLEGKSSKVDNASTREAFITMDADVIEAKERLDSLKAIELFMEGRVKVMENVCRFMKKQMDLILRQGFDSNIYYNKK